MSSNKIDIFVYAHWYGMTEPLFIGVLSAHQGKGKKSFSFEYNKEWITSESQLLLDPDIGWYGGAQFPGSKENFGVFMDSIPDTWGRTLMRRREVTRAKEGERPVKKLYDIDFLLGVYDEGRMGGLRFKLDKEGPFLDYDPLLSTPPWSSIRELQHSAKILEDDDENKSDNTWIAILMAPGSSLGGARPKANILDDEKHPWIAKFPSKNDVIDKAAWEFLAFRLARLSGIEMMDSKIQKVAGRFHTFFTKRFDRFKQKRIHFASAMTMTGNNEDTIRDAPASYLDIAEFIQTHCDDVDENLVQLWRRIVFNIAISNTDDHLRNHGFIIKDNGWHLSPAYDLNPSIEKDGLALNIDMDSNALDLELAKSVGEYFQLSEIEMEKIIDEVLSQVSQWKALANEIGIPRSEQELMAAAFNTKRNN